MRESASFEICDVRKLHEKTEWISAFDIVLCCENIEHILDDFLLVKSMAACLKPGGRLLLTTPHLHRIPQNFMDYGPFPDFEDGRHVRAGYNRSMLGELCAHSGLIVEEFSFISGPISQLHAWILWQIGDRSHPLIGWVVVLPLRALPPLFDKPLMRLFGFAPFCIGLEAYKAAPGPALNRPGGEAAWHRMTNTRRPAQSGTDDDRHAVQREQFQAEYYARNGAHYDRLHVDPRDEHAKALGWLGVIIDQYAFQSLLDVGSGTGRALLYLKDRPRLELKGIEPSQTMREIGYSKGSERMPLAAGDALSLAFEEQFLRYRVFLRCLASYRGPQARRFRNV